MNDATTQDQLTTIGNIGGVTPPLEFRINYTSNGAPTWECDGQTSGPCKARGGAWVNFTFSSEDDIAAQVSEAVMLIGPRGPTSGASPFDTSNVVMLTPKTRLQIMPDADGTWGFSISFMIKDGDNTSFHFLPDPELAVTSHPPRQD
jgi:hypothetical protein